MNRSSMITAPCTLALCLSTLVLLTSGVSIAGAQTPQSPSDTPSPEALVETYYTGHVWRGVSAPVGVYSTSSIRATTKDRGPVLVTMLRAHVEF